MKKILLGAATLSVIFATSCKKDDNGPSNSFTLAGATYNPTIVSKSDAAGYSVLASTDQTNVYTIQFNIVPVIGGTFNIVDDVEADNQIKITAVTQGGVKSIYESIDNAGTANVTISNGKMSVTLSDALVKRTNTSSMKSDTVRTSAVLTQQ
ncbi:hypothetical protein [Taibaiella soli]|uniref:Uncharacterized protein n=1 Tax=Taibaiella soli TaxID=1649169 RepID=A0A2W2BFK6_9BACT|nr:hypothetical protein [Taibaiella soli]PZF75019.1 hypothetical protein DN068_00245 [Taibaiella soli]